MEWQVAFEAAKEAAKLDRGDLAKLRLRMATKMNAADQKAAAAQRDVLSVARAKQEEERRQAEVHAAEKARLSELEQREEERREAEKIAAEKKAQQRKRIEREATRVHLERKEKEATAAASDPNGSENGAEAAAQKDGEAAVMQKREASVQQRAAATAVISAAAASSKAKRGRGASK